MPSTLAHLTPLPPARNGIADYAYRIMEPLSEKYAMEAYCEDPFAQVPRNVTLLDAAQYFRAVERGATFLYQIGNNWDHTFVLKTALRHPGIVVLHDLRLLYLYQSTSMSESELEWQYRKNNFHLADAYLRAAREGVVSSRLPHIVFSMLRDVLDSALAVVVHSNYAKATIRRTFGDATARKVHTIPHFSIEGDVQERRHARARLSLQPDWFVVVTAGFATEAKQLALVAEALSPIVRSERKVMWVHAGSYRAEEFDLAAALDRYPEVRRVTRITGYLPEEELDTYIAAADLLLNLRFPSVGESSGILSRAFPLGTCSVVTDTAAYAELPSDAVVKVPAFGGARALEAALRKLMEDEPLRQRFAANARRFATEELSLGTYTQRLSAVIDRVAAGTSTGVRSPLAAERPVSSAEPDVIWIGPLEDGYDGFDVLRKHTPPDIDPIETTYHVDPPEVGQGVFLRIAGRRLS